MPSIRSPSRYQRHFSPLTARSVFKAELYQKRAPIAYHVIYPLVHNVPENCPADPFTVDPAALEADSTVVLIPKPPGEVTRLKRDGYNLRDKLAESLEWKENDYLAFVKLMNSTGDGILDLKKTWDKQTLAKKQVFLKAARIACPILNRFVNAWPALDCISTHCKNKVQARKQAVKGKGKAKSPNIADEDEGEDEIGNSDEDEEEVRAGPSRK